MNPLGTPASPVTLRTALPLHLPGGKSGALLLHGFTGTPRDLEELGARLNAAGLTVAVPRLPGHGTNGGDFLRTGWRDWVRESVDSYADLSARCGTVHLVGFSMGGLLAILLASRFPVGRLVLLAPAVRASNPLLPLSPFLRLFIRRAPWPVTAPQKVVDEDVAALSREYWRWRYPAQAASLRRLQVKARRALPRVTADTLTLIGGADPTVPFSEIPFIEGRIASATKLHTVFPESGHLLLAGEDGKKACAEVVDWLVG
jgi:carboxylesterase